jgi:hypothetical protein
VGRTVTLVLVTADGEVLGALPAFPVASPWYQDIAPVVEGALEEYGLPVTVLRLLDTDGPQVRYLASTVRRPAVPLAPATVDPAPQPHRAPYAELGGPEASLAWTRGVLGLPGDAPARQVRTWNLASLWVLETPTGRVWLKEVPAFFAHEGAVVAWLAGRYPDFGPDLLAVDGARVLLAEIPGEDRYDAPLPLRLRVLERVCAVQRECVEAVPELLALGVPDRRPPMLTQLIRDTVRRYTDRPTGHRLLAGLDARLAELPGCGIPDTLVHGDLYPGNVRGTDTADTVLDWGDSCVGHPGFDLLRMVEGLEPAEAAQASAAWCAHWRGYLPDSRPERALELLGLVSALRNAAVYAGFLDHIEPAEQVYHRADVPHWLDVAIASLDAS